ncbi:MAG: O-antigen ligase family protein [Rhodobacteraceae bacterium]|nr:O-antigen ligase family protein [Paracoccaceae bacterium]
MTTATATSAARAAAPAQRANGSTFWALYDLGLAFFLLITMSTGFLQLGLASLQWLLCYGLLILRIVLGFQDIAATVLRNRVLFFYLGVCCASVLWSLAPSATLVSSVQLAISLLFGVFLGARYSLRALVVLIFWSAFVLVVLSVLHAATGAFPIDRVDRGGRLIGVFGHKSYLARQTLLCTLTALAILMTRGPAFGRATRLSAGLGIALSLALIGLSQSMTNLLVLPLMVGLLGYFCRYHLPATINLMAIAACVLLVALVPVGFALAGIDPLDALFEVTGKDRTLTGRTLIWDIALDQIADHPLIGVGFAAFWEAPQFASDRYRILVAGATSPSLHNFVLEILVATGGLGLIAMGLHIFTCARRCFGLWRATRSVASACCLVIVVMFTLLALNTPGLYGQHEGLLILITAFAISARKDLGRLRAGG